MGTRISGGQLLAQAARARPAGLGKRGEKGPQAATSCPATGRPGVPSPKAGAAGPDVGSAIESRPTGSGIQGSGTGGPLGIFLPAAC